jgi:hypothetical protein
MSRTAFSGSLKGQASAISGDMIGILILVIIAVSAVIPIVKDQINTLTNLSTTERTILNLVTLFIIIGIVFVVIRATGLI